MSEQDGRVVILRMEESGRATFLYYNSAHNNLWGENRAKAARFLPKAADDFIIEGKFPFKFKPGEVFTDTTWHPEIEEVVRSQAAGIYADPKLVNEYVQKFGLNSLIYFTIKVLIGDPWLPDWSPSHAQGLQRHLETWAEIHKK